MIKIASFELVICYSALAIWDPSINKKGFLESLAQHQIQGFTWILGNVNYEVNIFDGEVGFAFIEVLQAESVSVQDDSVRAILVPFAVGNSGVVFASPTVENVRVIVPEGNYALVFEIKLRNDAEYLNSSRYQEDLETSLQSIWCRFTFIPQENVEPEILRADDEIIDSSFPFLMDAELAY